MPFGAGEFGERSLLRPQLSQARAVSGDVMVQFFFNIREDDAFVPDVEGEALPSVDAAIAQAVDIATLIAREHLPERKSQTIVVEVRDEHGAGVLTTTMSLKIEPVKAYVMPGRKSG